MSRGAIYDIVPALPASLRSIVAATIRADLREYARSLMALPHERRAALCVCISTTFSLSLSAITETPSSFLLRSGPTFIEFI